MKTFPNEEFEVVLKFEPQKGLGGGFYQEWVSGEDLALGVEFGLNSGAGCGNPIMTFWIKNKEGDESYSRIQTDMRDLVRTLLSHTVSPEQK